MLRTHGGLAGVVVALVSPAHRARARGGVVQHIGVLILASSSDKTP